MNKLELSIELSFDIDAGTIEPFDDVKLNTNRLIHPEVFFKRYQNYKMDLKDKTYIDTTAQQVLKIAESVIKNVIKENDGCICDANTNYETDVDRVNIADVVYPGYNTGLSKRVSFIELLSNCVASFFQNRNSTAWQISLKILYVRNSKHHCPCISCQMVEQRLLTLV